MAALDVALLQFQHAVLSRDAQSDPHSVAQAGMAGAPKTLPFADKIRRSFGRHDVSSTPVYTGGAADDATSALGARAYATDGAIVLGPGADLHTVAHEAAHIVQQRSGIALKGVGRVGDEFERHADDVAALVVQGRSAETLLDRYAGVGATAPQGALQLDLDQAAVRRRLQGLGPGRVRTMSCDALAEAATQLHGWLDQAEGPLRVRIARTLIRLHAAYEPAAQSLSDLRDPGTPNAEGEDPLTGIAEAVPPFNNIDYWTTVAGSAPSPRRRAPAPEAREEEPTESPEPPAPQRPSGADAPERRAPDTQTAPSTDEDAPARETEEDRGGPGANLRGRFTADQVLLDTGSRGLPAGRYGNFQFVCRAQFRSAVAEGEVLREADDGRAAPDVDVEVYGRPGGNASGPDPTSPRGGATVTGVTTALIRQWVDSDFGEVRDRLDVNYEPGRGTQASFGLQAGNLEHFMGLPLDATFRIDLIRNERGTWRPQFLVPTATLSHTFQYEDSPVAEVRLRWDISFIPKWEEILPALARQTGRVIEWAGRQFGSSAAEAAGAGEAGTTAAEAGEAGTALAETGEAGTAVAEAGEGGAALVEAGEGGAAALEAAELGAAGLGGPILAITAGIAVSAASIYATIQELEAADQMEVVPVQTANALFDYCISYTGQFLGAHGASTTAGAEGRRDGQRALRELMQQEGKTREEAIAAGRALGARAIYERIFQQARPIYRDRAGRHMGSVTRYAPLIDGALPRAAWQRDIFRSRCRRFGIR